MIMTKNDQKESVVNESFGDTGASQGMVRFFINVGRKQKVKAKDIVRTIAEETGLSSQIIGKIDIFDKFSFVEVPEENASEVVSVMGRSKIKGRSVNIEPANKKGN